MTGFGQNLYSPVKSMATSRNAQCGFVVMLGLAAAGPLVVAAQTAPLVISLRLRDTAQVPYEVLIPAQEAVTRIYRAAGVEAQWPNEESLSTEPGDPTPIGLLGAKTVCRLPSRSAFAPPRSLP
jgi:anti-sigma-K factor RskA